MNNDAKENIFKIEIEDFSSLGELSLFIKNKIAAAKQLRTIFF